MIEASKTIDGCWVAIPSAVGGRPCSDASSIARLLPALLAGGTLFWMAAGLAVVRMIG